MIPAPSIADAGCLALLHGLTSRRGLPSALDLELYARSALALSSRTSPVQRRRLHADVRLYLRARREQRRADRDLAMRQLHVARLALEAAEGLARVLPGMGAEALIVVARMNLDSVTARAAAVVSGR